MKSVRSSRPSAAPAAAWRPAAAALLHRAEAQPSSAEARPDSAEAGPAAALSREILDSPCPPLVRAGLLLLNGDWSAAHCIVQELDGKAAAHWHALAHRHEPDFDNSKYWIRVAGKSPVEAALEQAARQAGHAELVLRNGRWDALRFTDCFAQPGHAAWTRELDRLEIRALLEWCIEHPDGAAP